MSNPVVHFEIPVDNVKRAKTFYAAIFTWEMNSIPKMKYTILHTTPIDKNNMPTEPGAINGGMMKRQAGVQAPVITISVKNIDATLKKIAKNGGSIVHDKMAVGDMGFAAYFKDTEGNVMGLWENASQNKA